MAPRRGRSTSGDGMHITGSGIQINTGNIGGDQQQIHISGGATASTQLQAAQAKLAELTVALDDHAGQLNNADAARRAAARIDEELRSPAPDRRRIGETLETLGLAIGQVAAVVTIADGLATAVTALFN